MRKQAKIFFILILILFLALAINYKSQVNYPLAAGGENILVTISKGESVKAVGKKLKDEQIIKSDYYFKIYSYIHGLEAQIKAGSYEFNSGQSIKEIMGILTRGNVVGREREIKIIEGWRLNDIKNYLTANNITSSSDFDQISKLKAGNWNLNFPKPIFLNDAPAQAGLEGFLFPDTYRIFSDAVAEDIAKKMLANFDAKLTAQMRQDIAEQNKTIFEIVTMASLVEKEVRDPEDMKIVSGIFWDRIKNGQPLESCATLAFILGENKKQYSLEDTRINSPYNTYKNLGLPPGPICNPGLNALQAAIYPQFSEYNYFLSRSDNGQTVFSKTYEEHIKNKAKYLN